MAILADPTLKIWYQVARQAVQAIFVDRNSIFTPGRPIWSKQNLEEFHKRFVLNPDESSDPFDEKFRRQMLNADADVVQLAAELLFFHFLPGKTTGGDKKREQIEKVLQRSAEAPSLPTPLAAVLDLGVAKEGMAYKVSRPFMLFFLVELIRKWYGLPEHERATCMKDPWRFKKFVAAIEMPRSSSQKQILLYLVHPEAFEPIMSAEFKETIAEALAEPSETDEDPDKALFRIRERLNGDFGQGFSFFDPPVAATWRPVEEETGPGDKEALQRRYWKVAPGDGAKLWDECRRGGYICIGWTPLGDVGQMDEATFKRRQAQCLKRFPDWSERGSNQVLKFAKEIKVGDKIAANHGMSEVVGLGEVTGQYYHVPDSDYGHRFPVRWYDVEPRSVEKRTHWRTTLLELDAETFDDIQAAEHLNPEDGSTVLADRVGQLLLRRKNVLLYGPPGTGKTHASLMLSEVWERWQGKQTVFQVTFHPTFAYEDFIEGFRPDKTGRFELRSGIFVQAVDACHREPQRKFLLIIDELNRGDVARILGELITLIEADKRYSGASRKLPYSQREFWVPENLFILGTMNTADRSISLLDIAIRRRFCFVAFEPEADVIRNSSEHHHSVEAIDLAALMVGLNARLSDAGVDRDRSIGHSHFLIPVDVEDPLDMLRDRFMYDIIPLVEEYCYSDRPKMRQILSDLVTESGRHNLEILNDDDEFVRVLQVIAQGKHGSDEANDLFDVDEANDG